MNIEKLQVPDEFPFPFTPYDIQVNFMKTLYKAIEDRKLGIFESPTGTGKSLSIICGALTWLKDHEKRRSKQLSDRIAKLEAEKESYSTVKDDWLTAQSRALDITHTLHELKTRERFMLEYKEKIENVIKKRHRKSTKLSGIITKETVDKLDTPEQDQQEDEDLLLEEPAGSSISEDQSASDEDDEPHRHQYLPTQIIIASRTHSQLSQLLREIRRSPYGTDTRVISLASRQNYCINPNVKKLNNLSLINDKCLDMQKSRKKQETNENGPAMKKRKGTQCQCPYYKSTNVENLKDFALAEVTDIEDLTKMGQEMCACPYYASRKAVADAEVILVPYNTLLHKSTREASGIRLKDNILIIDEAHNILEALGQMHGSEISFPQLHYSGHALRCYKQRYNTMFAAATLLSLNQLIFVINRLIAIFDEEIKEDSSEIHKVNAFVNATQIDVYNFFNLVKFCRSSKIAQKVRSYYLKYPIAESKQMPPKKKGVRDFLESLSSKKNSNEETQEPPTLLPVPNNPLLALISFLETLKYSYNDGRILVTKSPNKQLCKFQFLVLNPSSNFEPLIQEARAVIVAGGTMKPNEEFKMRLFMGAGASLDRILEFSCDHIIPPQNILPIAVTRGLRNEPLLFNFANRTSLGDSLVNIIKRTCQIVKGGIVVFLPSYSYENWLYEQMKNVTLNRTLFREPQKSGAVDAVLERYASTIKRSKYGALMFSVVGGKLSEGLNFSDDLGRCVIVVGLPYANARAPDLTEKMAYLDAKEGAGAGRQFYENLCMKAVNQCIGRAVRHRNDYATVLLLDERYERSAINRALPDWIRRSLKVHSALEAFDLVDQFFKEKGSTIT